jgi:hypothetical protein
MILDSPIISGSLTQQAGQTAEIPRYTAVSSSFLAASASFDARIDSIESTTASFSPRINALESFTASANATYVNVSGDSMSGDLTITGSLIVTDRITAQEFYTEYVSSSVVFQSGSTKFGDSVDDVHSFTGSVQIDGDVIASNLEGVFSSSAQITGSLGNYYIVSGTITQTTWDNIENKPLGIVSGSDQLTSSYDDRYVISGSITQTTWDNIENKPLGIVSGAAQVTESLDIRYRLVGDDITFDELTFKPTLISGSSQLDGTTINNLTTTASGSFSGSFQGNGSLLRGLAAGAKFHTQSEAASTWTFIHNLSTQYPNVTVYGTNNNIILPQSITAINVDTLVLEFGTPVSGYATAGVGGIIEVNGRTVKQYFTSALEWRFEHNIGDRFINIQTFDTNYEKIIPQTIVLTDTTSSLVTFPEATEGWVVGTIGGDLPAISSSYGGYTLQISQNAPYTASWVEIADVLVSNAVNLKYNAFTASVSNNSFEVINDGSSLMNIAIGSSSIDNGTLTITADSFASDYAEDYTQLGTALVLKGDGIFSGSLVPAGNGIHNLGSADNPWKELFVSTGSINLVQNGQIAYSITAESIVTTDTLSSGAINLTNSLPEGIVSSSSQIVGILNPLNEFTTSTTARLNSIETISASNIARINSLETTSASVDTLNTTQNTRLTNLEIKTGSLATTGSNTFIGTQTITGSLFISSDLIVQGSSSLQNITASAVSIGTNIVNLNTANPAIRYAGLSIGDSGSIGGSGSFLYDSVEDEMLFIHRGDSTIVTSSVVLMGPQTYDSVGNELYLTVNRIPKGGGNEHLVDSNISDNGTKVTITSGLDTIGAISASTFTGLGNLTIYSSSVDSRLVINSNSAAGAFASASAFSASAASRMLTFATTGSNTLVGRQTISGVGADGVVLSADSNDTNNSGRLFFMRTGGEGWAIMNNSGNLSFRSNAIPGSTSGSERMRLDTSYNLILNNGLSVAGATNLTGALRMNNGTGGSSPRITFGTEDESVPGNKSIYLDTYWMILQPHVNEGLRVRFVNGSGSQTETVRLQSTQASFYTSISSTGGISASGNMSARNFNKSIKSFTSNGAYTWSTELLALSDFFDSAGWYKGFIRESNGAHYYGYQFDIHVGQIGYGSASLQFVVRNMTFAGGPWLGGCGGSSFAAIDNSGFTKQNSGCFDSLELFITRLG